MRLGWMALVLVACGGPVDEDRCTAPRGVDTSPRSIADAMILLDSLPRPVTVPCFLESLERPLGVEATYSVFSAQPSAGLDAPRIFVLNGPLGISVVPAGDGRPLVEFGEQTAPDRTLKGELELPLTDERLDPAAPFERVRTATDDASVCGSCHLDEAPYGDLGGFDSVALAPTVTSIADLEELRAARAACDPALDDACAMLAALFDHGEVVRQPFPETFPTLND